MDISKKTAIIVGASGQDGTILSFYLKRKGYKVIGIDKKKNKQVVKNIDITNEKTVLNLIKKTKPEKIYFLAAYHKSSQDNINDYGKEMSSSFDVNVLALINFLEAIRKSSPKSRIFYAGSSLMFGNKKPIKKTEFTPFCPDNIYGITKATGANLCRMYREKYGIFASVGILFNHESEYRTDNFIFMKIIKGANDIRRGEQKKIIVGNLTAKVDWGYAYDFIEAMYLILKNNKADDFIISTGKLHKVQDLIEVAFNYLGLDWRKHIIENKELIKEKRLPAFGDYSKLKKATGWMPKNSFEDMIKKTIKKI